MGEGEGAARAQSYVEPEWGGHCSEPYWFEVLKGGIQVERVELCDLLARRGRARHATRPEVTLKVTEHWESAGGTGESAAGDMCEQSKCAPDPPCAPTPILPHTPAATAAAASPPSSSPSPPSSMPSQTPDRFQAPCHLPVLVLANT